MTTEDLETLESPPEEKGAVGDDQPGEAQPEEHAGDAGTEKDGADAGQEEHKDPETVPYSRFKEVYGALKRTERDLAAERTGKREPGGAEEQLQGVGPKPKSSDYEDYDSYIEALTDWKASQVEAKLDQRTQKKQQEENKEKWDSQVAEAMAKDPQFLEKGYIPHGLVEVLEGTDRLSEFAYFFGENPAEARRILSLSPLAQAREIGKLEAGFIKTGPQRKTTTGAPKPTKPVGTSETVSKSLGDLSGDDDYEAYKKARMSGAK